MPRKAVVDITDEALPGNLDRYRKMAVQLGATDAKVVPANLVMVEERVRAKCYYPKCGSWGSSANCPPHTMEIDQVRKVLGDYRYGVFFKMETPPLELTGSEVRSKGPNTRSQVKVHEIVSKIESEAFYDGYYLALGFGAGSCKRAFCPNDDCAALIPGKTCRHPLKARPSMEAMGMNAFAMAKKVGWDVYPLGWKRDPDGVPFATRLGIVLIC